MVWKRLINNNRISKFNRKHLSVINWCLINLYFVYCFFLLTDLVQLVNNIRLHSRSGKGTYKCEKLKDDSHTFKYKFAVCQFGKCTNTEQVKLVVVVDRHSFKSLKPMLKIFSRYFPSTLLISQGLKDARSYFLNFISCFIWRNINPKIINFKF